MSETTLAGESSGPSPQAVRAPSEQGIRSWLFWLMLGLAFLEILSKQFGNHLTALAAWIWVGLAATTFFWAAGLALVYVVRWCGRREWLILLAVFLGGIASFEGIGGHDRVQINYESAVEVSEGLWRWEKNDLGYHERAFLDYHSRQYLLVSVPALLGGRTLLNLRLGYALIFFVSFLFFLVGAYRFGKPPNFSEKNSATGIFTGLSGLAILGFPVVVLWLKNYEQTLLPLSFTLLAMGWLLSWLREPSRGLLVPLAWSTGMLATMYTPGLAAWSLALAAFIYLIWKTPSTESARRCELTAVLVYVVVIGAVGFLSLWHWLPAQFELGTTNAAGVFSKGHFLARIVDGLPAILSNHGIPFISPLLAVVFIAQLIFCAARPTQARHPFALLIWLWSALSIAAALSMRGWDQRPPRFDLHRAMIVIPPLAWLVFDFWRHRLQPNFARWRLPLQVFALALATTTLFQLRTAHDVVSLEPYRPRTEHKILVQILSFLHSLPSGSPPIVVISPAAPMAGAIEDPLKYFFPSVVVTRWNPSLAALQAHHHPFVFACPESEFRTQKISSEGLKIFFFPLSPSSPADSAYVLVEQK